MLDTLLIVVPLVVLVAAAWISWRSLRQRPPARRVKHKSRRVAPPSVATADQDLTQVAPRRGLPRLQGDDEPLSEVDDPPSRSMTFYEPGAEEDEQTAFTSFLLVFASGQTDPGKARSRNEDSILLLPDAHVFAVADGMGGHAGGDVASRIAVQAIERAFRSGKLGDLTTAESRPRMGNELVWAVREANQAIRQEARRRPEYHGMGATFVGARFSDRKTRAYIGHVGDSRCYRWRRGELKLMTQDHTMAAYGVAGPLGARVRRALGVQDEVAVDLCVDRPEPGDLYLLCSDGLNKMLSDAEIGELLAANATDLDHAVKQLIWRANRAGGRDNVSVILVGLHSRP